MRPSKQKKTIKRGSSKTTPKVSSVKNRASAHVSEVADSRRLPRQERAKFTVDAILRAAVEVVDEIGWANASTNRIAKRAGVSIGSLYQYFDSKESILERLYLEHHEEVKKTVESVVEQYNSEESLAIMFKELFRRLVALHREDPLLTKMISNEVPRHNPHQGHEDDSQQFADLLGSLLRLRGDVKVRQPRAAAHILVVVAESLTRWLAHDVPDYLDTEELIQEIADMMSHYLHHQSQ